VLARTGPNQEEWPLYFGVTVITVIKSVPHFWKTEMVKQKIYEDNIVCNKLYLQGSVRGLRVLQVGFQEKFLEFLFHSLNLP